MNKRQQDEDKNRRDKPNSGYCCDKCSKDLEAVGGINIY